MKIKFLKIFSILAIVGMAWLPANSFAGGTASANGKYSGLLQELTCAADRAKYGEYRDYGYWSGGSWCGQQGKAGFWVWVNPTWYVWASKASSDASSVNGKYTNLLQTLHCPKDKKKYGSFRDYGYWAGGAWCGQKGKAGHWVWVAPNWYVWGNKR